MVTCRYSQLTEKDEKVGQLLTDQSRGFSLLQDDTTTKQGKLKGEMRLDSIAFDLDLFNEIFRKVGLHAKMFKSEATSLAMNCQYLAYLSVQFACAVCMFRFDFQNDYIA